MQAKLLFNDNEIKVRADGYINISDIESFSPNLSIYDWMMYKDTSIYIDEVSKKVGRSALEYAYGHESNVYAHPELAINYSLLANKSLGLWLDKKLIKRETKLLNSLG